MDLAMADMDSTASKPRGGLPGAQSKIRASLVLVSDVG